MATFVENREFQIPVRNFLAHGEDFLKTAHGCIGPEDHPVSLSREMQDIGALAGNFEQALDELLGAGYFKTCAQRAAGVDQCDEVLWMALGGAFEQGQRFIETVRLPQSAGLLQLWQVNAEAGNGLNRAFHRRIY